MKAVFISLGCDKNTTDSEKIFKLFIKQTGAVAVLNPEEADVAIINTCSFIRDAKKELTALKYDTFKDITSFGSAPATIYFYVRNISSIG